MIDSRGSGGVHADANSSTTATASAHDEADINIDTAEPEFCEWRWVEPRSLVQLAVPFKRDVYSALMDSFAGLIYGPAG